MWSGNAEGEDKKGAQCVFIIDNLTSVACVSCVCVFVCVFIGIDSVMRVCVFIGQ
jgi:hypothetical protein